MTPKPKPKPRTKPKNKGGRPPVAAAVHKMQIRISEDTYQALAAFAELQGRKSSATVRDLLVEVEPTLRATVEAYRKAVEGRPDAFDGLSKGLLAKAITEAQKMQGDLLEYAKK